MSTNRRLVLTIALATAGAAVAAGVIVAHRAAPTNVTSRREARDANVRAADRSMPTAQQDAVPSPAEQFPAAPADAAPAADASEPRTSTHADQPAPANADAPRSPARADRAARVAARMDAAPAKPPSPAAVPAVEPLIPVPQARMALSFVGADPMAEDVWVAAINDPALPPETRKDLIEDLNEDGFADPKHITEDDLPLIMSRLELITALAPDSMDDVNAAAFAEAYKDLVNMVYRLMGQ